jgi:hypothetical protein
VSALPLLGQGPPWTDPSRGPRVHAPGACVTPYFSKRIEFYKFIYLNKHLIVAFYADAYFPLCREVFLYFIVQVEVIEIQI